MNTSKDLLLIFTRNPELGKVKTRLAKGVGAEAALTIYKQLLTHTQEQVLPLSVTKRVGYSNRIGKKDVWEDAVFEKFVQKGNDLGTRMEIAFDQGFTEGFQKIIIIGSDLYDLRTAHLKQAFKALDTHEAVIGPALDGGYYLLGLRRSNDIDHAEDLAIYPEFTPYLREELVTTTNNLVNQD